MEKLPVEVVGHIFSFIPTKDLYPHCFCINSFCLFAVLLDVEWKHRCSRELSVEDPLPNLSWKDTYRESTWVWDPAQATLPQEQRQSEKLLPNQYGTASNEIEGNLTITPSSVEWKGSGYAVVRAKRSISERSIVSVEWTIQGTFGNNHAVGFIGDGWDCRNHGYVKEEVNLCYWNNGRAYDVSGYKNQDFNWPGWKDGQVITGTVDMAKRIIHYFLDGEYVGTWVMHESLQGQVWPVAALYSNAPKVTMKARYPPMLPPEGDEKMFSSYNVHIK